MSLPKLRICYQALPVNKQNKKMLFSENMHSHNQITAIASEGYWYVFQVKSTLITSITASKSA